MRHKYEMLNVSFKYFTVAFYASNINKCEKILNYFLKQMLTIFRNILLITHKYLDKLHVRR